MNRNDVHYVATPPREAQLLEKALRAFERETGIPAQCEQVERLVNDRRVDAIVQIGEPPAKATKFIAEIRRIDRFGALGAIKDAFAHQALPHPLLLVAPYITPKAAEQCRNMQLPFLDTAGNAYIKAPGLFVYIRGQQKPEEEPALLQGKATTATALRVTFVLLCNEELLNAPYRQIAKAANVAL